MDIEPPPFELFCHQGESIRYGPLVARWVTELQRTSLSKGLGLTKTVLS